MALPAQPPDLTTCQVGIAFYRSDDGNALDTSVAQVFNERGGGVIVRGVHLASYAAGASSARPKSSAQPVGSW